MSRRAAAPPSAQPAGSGQADASAPTCVRITEGAQVLSTGPGGNRAPCLASASPWCPDTWTVWTLEGVREHRVHGRRREDSGGAGSPQPKPPPRQAAPLPWRHLAEQQTSAGISQDAAPVFPAPVLGSPSLPGPSLLLLHHLSVWASCVGGE